MIIPQPAPRRRPARHHSTALYAPQQPRALAPQRRPVQPQQATLLAAAARPVARSPMGAPIPFRRRAERSGFAEPLLNALLLGATVVGLGCCML